MVKNILEIAQRSEQAMQHQEGLTFSLFNIFIRSAVNDTWVVHADKYSISNAKVSTNPFKKTTADKFTVHKKC